MARQKAAAAAILLAVTAIAAAPVTGGAQPTPEASTANGSAMAPGERFGAVLGIQGAELAGDLERRTFGIRVARAASEESRAAIVAQRIDVVEATLEGLADRKRALHRARENGTISNGTYDAQMAIVAARQSNVQRQLEASERASANLSPALREREGIGGSRIQALEEEAATLTGPRVAATVRTIAGPDVGTLAPSDPVPVTVDTGKDVSPAGNRTPTGETPRGLPVDTGSTTTDGVDGDEEDDGPLTVDLG